LSFLNYDEIILSLKNEKEKSEYFSKLNYDAMLYLDINNYEFLKSINPDSNNFEKFEDWILIKEFDVNIKNIKEFFVDRVLFKKITADISGEISYDVKPIYLKSPNKAVYEITAKKNDEYFWIKIVGLLLENSKLKSYHIYELIE
jgi:hypothetical protein